MADQDTSKREKEVTEEALHENELAIVEEQTSDKTESDIENVTTDNAPEENELATITAALEETQKDLAEAKEKVLRAYADVQNAKRRAQMDVEKAHKFALDKFVESLLPVIDSLERGLATESTEESSNAMKEGMELTLKLFIDTLKKFNVEQLSPEGEPFNPEHHQAVSQIENPDTEPGSVLNVFQKGYLLNGRLVRPAMVIVAK